MDHLLDFQDSQPLYGPLVTADDDQSTQDTDPTQIDATIVPPASPHGLDDEDDKAFRFDADMDLALADAFARCLFSLWRNFLCRLSENKVWEIKDLALASNMWDQIVVIVNLSPACSKHKVNKRRCQERTKCLFNKAKQRKWSEAVKGLA
jgi:hypothetical protein